ncbi:hypothetical protein J2S17_002645 [Cytobacillus purgationiresistens]|uniref:Uncharacterized protein n=1 Tax=Cytobacillus purgationiresistens TaxID=863449 RepID=A0ABU0AHN0_9BACI|nr:hypothetical protein [Cytobacillus purgationiresistens]
MATVAIVAATTFDVRVFANVVNLVGIVVHVVSPEIDYIMKEAFI